MDTDVYKKKLDNQGGQFTGLTYIDGKPAVSVNGPGKMINGELLEVYDSKWGYMWGSGSNYTAHYWDSSTPRTGVTATKTGYTFTGYYTATSGGTKVIDANGNLLVEPNFFKKDSTIYAQWTPNTYQLTVVPNGGKFYSPTGDLTDKSWSKDFTYSEKTYFCTGHEGYYNEQHKACSKPTRVGHNFIGWETSPGGTVDTCLFGWSDFMDYPEM